MRHSLKSESAPELVDLEAMLANVQRQIQEEIDSSDLSEAVNTAVRRSVSSQRDLAANQRTTGNQEPNFTDQTTDARANLQYQNQMRNDPRASVNSEDIQRLQYDQSAQNSGISPSRLLNQDEFETEFRARTNQSTQDLRAKNQTIGQFEPTISALQSGSTRSLNQIQQQKSNLTDGSLANLSKSSAALPISGNFLHQMQNKLEDDRAAASWTLPRNKKFEDPNKPPQQVEAEVKDAQNPNGQRKSMDSVPEAWKNYWSWYGLYYFCILFLLFGRAIGLCHISSFCLRFNSCLFSSFCLSWIVFLIINSWSYSSIII